MNRKIILFSAILFSFSLAGSIFAEDGEKPSGPATSKTERSENPQQEGPRKPLEYCKSGLKFLLDKQYDKAESEFEKALELDPNLFDAYQGMGFLNYQTGQYAKAFNNFFKASQLNPDNERPYCGMGASSNAMNKPKAAVHYLEEAIKLNSSYAEAYFQLGKAQYDLKENAKAKENFIKAKELFQGDQQRHSTLDRTEEINQLLDKIP